MKNYPARFSGTLIAALILALILGYLLLFEGGQPDREGNSERVFAEIDKAEINELELKYPKYTVLSYREEGKWFVLKNSKRLRADDQVISSIIKEITEMKIEKVVSEYAADLAEFGLDSPKLTVTMRTSEEEYGLRVGGKSPIGSGKYVQTGNDNRIVLVDENSVWQLMGKRADDLKEGKP